MSLDPHESTRTRIFKSKKKTDECPHGSVWTWLVFGMWWKRVDKGCSCPDPPLPDQLEQAEAPP